MQRRSALGRLAAMLTGLSLGRLPKLQAAAPPPPPRFSVTRANVAESSGIVTCPTCHEMGDALGLTPAGPCVRCADLTPELRAEPRSDRFWLLSPDEIRRAEFEIERVAAELDRMNRHLAELGMGQIASGDGGYARAIEGKRDQWQALQRELHLLQLLRAASRQFGSCPC